MQNDRTSIFQRTLIDAPRWLLLAMLIFAPWAYGCTRTWTILAMTDAMLLLLVLWAAGCAWRRQFPRVSKVLWISTAYLLFQGWWMNANAQYYYDTATFTFVPIDCIWTLAPGVIDRSESLPLMMRITGLVAVIWFVADLSQREEWRRRIWLTVGLTGGTLILYGLIQRMLGAPMIFWELGTTGEQFFATYYYHGNAAAFINLVLPLIAGKALLAFRAKDGGAQQAVWLPALLITLAGAVATASKAGVVITFAIAAAFTLWRAKIFGRAWRGVSSMTVRFAIVTALVFMLGIFGWFSWARIMQRWTPDAWVTGSYGTRLLTYKTCLSMLPDSTWWGFGPGNFSITFPHYTGALGDKIEGFWRFAHQDYLQTVIEWGWIGGPLWGVPFLGGIVAGIRTYRKRALLLSSQDRTLLFTTVLALAGIAVHALIDFPLQITSLQLYAAVYLGLAWGSASWNPTRSESGERE